MIVPVQGAVMLLGKLNAVVPGVAKGTDCDKATGVLVKAVVKVKLCGVVVVFSYPTSAQITFLYAPVCHGSPQVKVPAVVPLFVICV